MGSVSSDLKSEREKRKISLAQIAADTHISLHHLENLEEGRFGNLPGGIYNRAFLRAYCECLNLDFQDIMERFEAETAAHSDKAQKIRMPAVQKDSPRFRPLIIWSLLLFISATGLFLNRKWIAAVFSPYFSHDPVATVPHAPPETRASEASLTPAPESSDPVQLPEALPAASPTPEQPLPLPFSPDQAAGQTLRLQIDATEACWISVDRDGTPAIRKLLEPGENHSFAANEQFMITVGNAGGISLKINGRPAKPLGKSGEVVKIMINASNLQDLLGQGSG